MTATHEVKPLSIIIISYNTCEMTLKAIRTLYENTLMPFELIVIDNASDDDSVQEIQKVFPDVILIANEDNIGFAAANNQAAKLAKGELLLLLNPDTEVLDKAVDHLYQFAVNNDECLIWGGRTLFADGSLNASSCWMQQSLWSLFCQAIGFTSIFRKSSVFNPEAIRLRETDTEKNVDIVSGCFFMVDAKLWKAMDGFNLKYFMYGEEADFCLRATRMKNAHPKVTSKATIIHHGGASEKNKADKIIKLLKAKMSLLNDHLPNRKKYFAQALLKLWPYSRYLAFSLLKILRVIDSEERLTIWKLVWQKKNEWARGW